MAESLGTPVEFLSGGSLKIGVVTGDNKGKLEVTDQNGRRHSVPERNVLVRHEEVGEEAISEIVGAIQERIDRILADFDTELLWESIREQQREFQPEELAEIYFGSSQCCNLSAALRAVLQDPVHFRVRGPHISPRPTEQVAAQLTAARRHEEKEALRNRTRSWLAEVLAGEQASSSLSDSERELISRRLEDFLVQRQRDDEVAVWLQDLDPDLTPRMAAYDILATLGRLPASADPLLVAAGIDPRFSREALDFAANLNPYTGSSNRVRRADLYTLAIDDEETREIDDAFSIAPDADGVTVFIHISDVSHFVEKADPLDHEAQRRISSVYLPQTTVRMLPEPLSCDLGSLREGVLRPALTLRARFDLQHRLVEWSFERTEITVDRHLTYDDADRFLQSDGDEILTHLLAPVHSLSRSLAEDRASHGALVFNKPELKVVARKDVITLKVIDTASPSRRLVSELMILLNHLAAQFSVERGIPLIYRSQPAPVEPLEVPETYDPVRFNQIFMQLERSRLSVEPAPHAGLGLEVYTQLTSPIRRYCDMVLQRQLIASVEGSSLPYTTEELAEALELIQSMDADIRAAERNANRFFVLSFLSENCRDRVFEGVVVRELGRGYLVETTEYQIRGLVHFAGELQPGRQLRLRVDQVHPARNILTFSIVE
jgi:exoribonuclease-2